ncbi:baseplate J/gp47 family protein [Clostridium chromiireducens]|uniref:Baseplate J/gp47 family protein n=1 Tax=Clostridium chromiireducens TaxID=225345 RepID=A0A399IIM0_9CLOT|nr:baseplate J/gp47 family protein [Clostridium chromiireducens]RII32858.1 baseplate J/gp47 family protein [Clostridium chromiireducens]
MSDMNFVEVDAESINRSLISSFETTLGETLYPGDERRIFLEQETPVIVALKNDINETAKKNLLRYATGETLDAFGEFYSCPRLKADFATVTERFNLSEAQSQDIFIASGKRVTPDGVLYFATTSDSIVPAGATYIDLVLTATQTGEKYNGFTPGQIKTLTDTIPYIASIVNIDTSSGGSDVEADDDGTNVWSGYRERIRLSPQSFSVAGPEGAYEYFALSADSTICDINVSSPSPGVVQIVVLQENGGIPSQYILDKVNDSVSAKNRRPLTDNVKVVASTVLNYDINLIYYIDSKNQTKETYIRNAIEGEGGAIDAYILWQQSNLGKAINPDYLKKLTLNAGADRVNIISPVYTVLTGEKVAKVGNKTITYGGLE